MTYNCSYGAKADVAALTAAATAAVESSAMAATAASTASVPGALAATDNRLAFALTIMRFSRKDGLQASSFGSETTSSDVAAPKSRSALPRRGAAALIGADLADKKMLGFVAPMKFFAQTFVSRIRGLAAHKNRFISIYIDLS